MCRNSSVAKATHFPPVTFPGHSLERYFRPRNKAVATQLEHFSPFALQHQYFPDLAHYLTPIFTPRADYASQQYPYRGAAPYALEHQPLYPYRGAVPHEYNRQYPEDIKRARYQQPPPGPPGHPDKLVFHHAAYPFIAIAGEKASIFATMKVLKHMLSKKKVVSTPFIVYSRIGASGCSKPGCAYSHYDNWHQIPPPLQEILSKWDTANKNVIIDT